jgi:hypothetical protein
VLLGLAISVAVGRALTRSRPFNNRGFGFARFGPVARENFGLSLLETRELLVDGACDDEMQLLTAALKQRFVSRVTDQCVLELIGRIRRDAADVKQFRVG